MELETVEIILDETEKRTIDAYLSARGFSTEKDWEYKLKLVLFLIEGK